MAKKVKVRQPKLVDPFRFPEWFHHHGDKMRVERPKKKDHKVLVISGSAAKITIRKASTVYPGLQSDVWLVDWEVGHPTFGIGECGVHGRACFSDVELKAAFNLTEDSGKHGEWLIMRHGADSAEQGKYIRWRMFLNIPCPGTGHDGDPNVSIFIEPKMQSALYYLLVGMK